MGGSAFQAERNMTKERYNADFNQEKRNLSVLHFMRTAWWTQEATSKLVFLQGSILTMHLCTLCLLYVDNSYKGAETQDAGPS